MGGWELLQRGRDVLIKSFCFKDVNNLTVLQFARCPSKLCLFVDLFFFFISFQLLSYSYYFTVFFLSRNSSFEFKRCLDFSNSSLVSWINFEESVILYGFEFAARASLKASLM